MPAIGRSGKVKIGQMEDLIGTAEAGAGRGGGDIVLYGRRPHVPRREES